MRRRSRSPSTSGRPHCRRTRRTVTLITTDDPLTGISAVPLIHFPDDAPILYVTKNGIPEITLNELKRLGDTGIVRPPMNNADAFLVGAAANPAVENQLKAIGMKYMTVTGSDVFQLADNVDKLYGSNAVPATCRSRPAPVDGSLREPTGTGVLPDSRQPPVLMAVAVAATAPGRPRPRIPPSARPAPAGRRPNVCSTPCGTAAVLVGTGPDRTSRRSP